MARPREFIEHGITVLIMLARAPGVLLRMAGIRWDGFEVASSFDPRAHCPLRKVRWRRATLGFLRRAAASLLCCLLRKGAACVACVGFVVGCCPGDG